MAKTSVHVGTSGWVYPHWRGRFYPEDLPQKRWFAHFAERFSTVEINNTFYRLPTPAAVEAWREQAPEGFFYAVKASRYMTHLKRLLDPEEPIRRFFDAIEPLGGALGPVLFQLPGQMRADVPRLRHFLEALPPERTYVFEFRHASWFTDEVYDLLGEHGGALCVHDWRGWTPMEATARLVYVRFHGTEGGSAGLYSEKQLEAWARRVTAWRRGGHDVLLYFNNDLHGHAITNAAWLAKRVGDAKPALKAEAV